MKHGPKKAINTDFSIVHSWQQVVHQHMTLHLPPYYTRADHKATADTPLIYTLINSVQYVALTSYGNNGNSNKLHTIKFQLSWRERSLPICSTLSKHVTFKFCTFFAFLSINDKNLLCYGKYSPYKMIIWFKATCFVRSVSRAMNEFYE